MRSDRGIGGVGIESAKVKKYVNHIKEKKNLWMIALGALLGGILLLVGGDKNETALSLPSGEQSILLYEENLEQRITRLCEEVMGVSRVSVMVTLEGGFENVYARDEDFLTVGSGGSKSPVLIKQTLPLVRGVGIVCNEADDPTVQKEICELLSSALGIPSNRIYIVKGK